MYPICEYNSILLGIIFEKIFSPIYSRPKGKSTRWQRHNIEEEEGTCCVGPQKNKPMSMSQMAVTNRMQRVAVLLTLCVLLSLLSYGKLRQTILFLSSLAEDSQSFNASEGIDGRNDKIFEEAREFQSTPAIMNATQANNEQKKLAYLRSSSGKDAAIILQAREKSARLSSLYSQISQSKQQSPVCHPHFGVLSSNSTRIWSNNTKFKRLYFYHARKAGGTSLTQYFKQVAQHRGLEFAHNEYVEAEEPGSHELPTFYVTHLREPVSDR